VQREIGARPSEVRTLLNIGEVQRKQGSDADALRQFEQALAVTGELGDPILEVDVHHRMGEVLMDMGRRQEALGHLEQARRIADATRYRKGLVAAHEALAHLHRALGNDGLAYEHHVRFAALKDSLFNEESSKRIGELRMRYEVDLKDNQLELLERTRELQQAKLDRQRILFQYLVVGFIVLLILGWVAVSQYVKQRRSAFQRMLLETEQKALRAQMNPHFIFNVLNSIQYFASRNDTASVVLYLRKFTRLIRAILEQSRDPLIPLSQEISTLSLYLELEKMRFEDKFDYHIALDPAIEPELVRIPGMLVQPVVENAIKHGITHKEGEAHVDIRFETANGMLRCTVTDNGIGREAAGRMDAGLNGNGHLSAATEIIRERMDALSTTHRIRASCTTDDLHDGTGRPIGTRVVLDMPMERLN